MRCATISAAYPFEREVEGHHSYVTFVTDADVLDELAELAAGCGPDEKIERGDGVIYWQVPKTGTLDTTIGKTMGKKRYKSSTTTRNLRTIDKVLKALNLSTFATVSSRTRRSTAPSDRRVGDRVADVEGAGDGGPQARRHHR